ncbi:MAG: secretin N-terminal domain-containing protein [Anaerohalosphaeraceae bacterium]
MKTQRRKQKKLKFRTYLTAFSVWLLAVLGLTALVIGQENEGAAPAEAAEAAAPAEASPSPSFSMQSVQSISFRKDMPIRDALQMLAQMYHKNIVPSARVDGTVTVTNLYDVTFEEALQAILGTHKYEIKGNFVKIYTNEEFRADKTRFEYAVIPLYYINAEEAKKLAEPLLSEFGQLGVTSPAQRNTTPGQGGDSLAIHDRLVVSDYPENIRRIREVLADVDVEPLQVLLEVTVMEATLTEATKFGIDWSNVPGVTIDMGTGGFYQGGFAPAVTGTNASGITVGVTFDNIAALIKAVETISDLTIMANPKILALNKQAGKLIIGKEEGYQSLTNVAEGGTATQRVEFLESGTVLEFRPFIGKDGLIRMEIRPEQSNGEIVQFGSTQLPKKTKTEIMTNVMVRDGQTIVLGGLFKESTNLSRNQVPIVGDIPVIGELFRGVSDNSTRVELIILITPHIIQRPEQAQGAERLEDVQRLAHEARSNLYWMSRVKIDEDRYARAVQYYLNGDYNSAMTELNNILTIHRNYLEAIRLRERILRETQPQAAQQMERLMLQKIEREESGKWFRW